MFNRLFKKDDQTNEKSHTEDSRKSALDKLSQDSNVLDKEKMKQIEGGHTANQQFSERFDWNSTPGGNIPS